MDEGFEVLDRFQMDEIERAILRVKVALAQWKIENIKFETIKLKKILKAVRGEIKKKSRRKCRSLA